MLDFTNCLPDIKELSDVTSDNITFLLKFIFWGLLIAILYHYSLNELGFNYPWNTFLFRPDDRFNDWFNSVNQAASANPYFYSGPALATYFPAAYVLFKVGCGMNEIYSAIIYLTVTVFIFMCAFFFLYRLVYRDNSIKHVISPRVTFLLALASVISYPVLFSLDRGNIDLWISLLCVIFISTQFTKFEFLGILSLAIAISLKGYPAALLLLCLSEKKYLHILICLFFVLLVSIIPLCFMWDGYDINFSGLLRNMALFYEHYVIGVGDRFASSDPYNLLRYVFFAISKILNDLQSINIKDISRSVLYYYSYFSLVFAVTISFYVLFVSNERWRKIMALGLLMILFPNVANDYKLCILLPALYVLLSENLYNKPQRNVFMLVCFLMIPKSYFFINGISISIIINPLILIIIAFIILNEPNHWADVFKLLKSKMIFLNKYSFFVS